MTCALAALSAYARGVLLPLVRDRFADPVHGGFHERLDASLAPLPTGRKRLMVQARQLYLLSHAALLGDRSGERTAEQGYAFLRRAYPDRSHGGWHFAATPEDEPLDPAKDLYGHAFLLFALAWLHRAFAAPDALALAAETMDTLQARMALPNAGFYAAASPDWTPAPGALAQNPHMHLLEAVLALHEASHDGRWMQEADALVRLFHDRLFHRADAERLAAHLLHAFVPQDRTGWHETLTREGTPTMTDLPGSTPYHLFMAAAEAERLGRA